MDKYSLAFSVSNLGPKSFQKLVNKYGSSKASWQGKGLEFERLGISGQTFKKFEIFREEFDIDKYTEKLEKEKVFFISFFDKEYPKAFKNLENPPIGIFCKGNASLLRSNLKIAVVGTRKITQYGRSVTESLVSDLVDNDFCIVSGLALGVDGLSHRLALENKGATIAVMPCGVDCCLPSENFSVYSNILANKGLIISEYPLSLPPNKGTFLARNRLIAAMSEGVLVTEAAENSGSLVTADWGFRLSKKVFAVPGPINSQMVKGSLKLLKLGAKLVTEGKDILEEFSSLQKREGKSKKEIYKNLDKEEKEIVLFLQNESLGVEQMSKKLKIPTSKLSILISGLELRGIVAIKNGQLLLQE